jgi:hypothetical protein
VSRTARILAFGKSPGTVAKGVALLNAMGFDADGVVSLDAAADCLAASPYDLVVIGGGVGKQERAGLRELLRSRSMTPPVIEVRGLGNLPAAVRTALGT